MAIVYDKLMALKIPDSEQSYTARDAIFYALSLGLGQNPLDEDELRFVYEKDLKVLPTFPCVVAHPGFWARDLDTGIDWVKGVHGEHRVDLHKPLPAKGSLIGHSRIVEIVDKGPGKGALIFSERKLHDKATGELLATINQTSFARGDGGFGGPQRPPPAPHAIPDRTPAATRHLPQRAALAVVLRR